MDVHCVDVGGNTQMHAFRCSHFIISLVSCCTFHRKFIYRFVMLFFLCCASSERKTLTCALSSLFLPVFIVNGKLQYFIFTQVIIIYSLSLCCTSPWRIRAMHAVEWAHGWCWYFSKRFNSHRVEASKKRYWFSFNWIARNNIITADNIIFKKLWKIIKEALNASCKFMFAEYIFSVDRCI